ncbi:MAG: anti-sigma factor [Solirubrobacterales bacterium]|nr:anti-sigma factor [Solirubrobacterales bacterium]
MNSGHERFKQQLPAYLLGSLGQAERLDFEHHLRGCAECRAELDWLEPAVDVLAADVEQVDPSPDLKRKVMASVEADLAETAPSPASGRLSVLLRPAVLGAVAAALFLGLMVGYLVDGDGGPDGPTRQVVTGNSTIGADAVMIASNGTGTLKVSNLKKPGPGRVYQAWIQRGQEIEPTDALFVPRGDGTAVASIPDIRGVSAVMVSAEPDGGSEQPTTAPVITVTMPS